MNTFISGYRKRQREPSMVVADQDYLQTVQLQLPGDRVDHLYADRHRDVAMHRGRATLRSRLSPRAS
jgi:hypothetical protein